MVGKKKIAVMTGAGVSVASGFPTYREKEGFWDIINANKYAGECRPENIATYKFFNVHPYATWQWHVDFFKILAKPTVKPNAGHYAIRDFQEYCALSKGAKKVESILVTQNIDNLHA